MTIIQAIIAKLFPQDVESIVRSFQKTQSKLLKLADKLEAEADIKMEQATQLQFSARQQAIEAGRAKSVADNLKKLCGEG